MTIRDAIAERLRLARQESRLSLRDVAAETGLSNTTIRNYERGYFPPTVEALLLLSQVYERDISWFLPQ